MKADVDQVLATALELESKLDETLEVLRKASNWGIADLFGGLAIVSGIKQSKMTKAHHLLQEVEAIARRLSDEMGGDMFLDLQDFHLTFSNDVCNVLDVVLDNTISDVTAQVRIEKAWKQTKELYDRNEILIKKLKSM